MEKYQRKQENEAPVADDPAARDLLKRAFAKTSRWPKGFGGFSADLSVVQAGRISKGTVELKSPREIQVRLDDPELGRWAEGQISMMAIHRGPRSFEESDGKYSLTLAEEDHHPLGRLVVIHGDGMTSRYRILDDRITQINRSMERIRFTINVDESMTTSDGKSLTTRYTVFYSSPSDGSLKGVESFWDQHAVIGGVYLPGTRRVSLNEDGGVTTRLLRFENHKLL